MEKSFRNKHPLTSAEPDLEIELADRDWWRSVCKILGATLIGWTFRDNATAQWGRNTIELDGSVVEKLLTTHDITQQSNSHLVKTALDAVSELDRRGNRGLESTIFVLSGLSERLSKLYAIRDALETGIEGS